MSDYTGRRLRCRGCRERLPQDKRAYDHAERCGSTVTFPYYPDEMDTDVVELGEFA